MDMDKARDRHVHITASPFKTWFKNGCYVRLCISREWRNPQRDESTFVVLPVEEQTGRNYGAGIEKREVAGLIIFVLAAFHTA